MPPERVAAGAVCLRSEKDFNSPQNLGVVILSD